MLCLLRRHRIDVERYNLVSRINNMITRLNLRHLMVPLATIKEEQKAIIQEIDKCLSVVT